MQREVCVMGDQRVERRQVYSRPQWASFQANGGLGGTSSPPSSPPPNTTQPRPTLSPAQSYDLVCKVRTVSTRQHHERYLIIIRFFLSCPFVDYYLDNRKVLTVYFTFEFSLRFTFIFLDLSIQSHFSVLPHYYY